jgi:hypothetical protein
MNLGEKGCTKRKNLWKKTHGLINLNIDEGNNPFKLGVGGGYMHLMFNNNTTNTRQK